MSRKSARESAYKLIYAFSITGELDEISLREFTEVETTLDADFCVKTVQAVIKEYEFLSSVISRFAKDYTFDRIYKADLSALMIATYEILFCDDIPNKVSVNEALELVKTYSYDGSSSFVNGILASVINNKEKLINEREDN